MIVKPLDTRRSFLAKLTSAAFGMLATFYVPSRPWDLSGSFQRKSIGEVARWMDECEIEFQYTTPCGHVKGVEIVPFRKVFPKFPTGYYLDGEELVI